MKANAEFQRVTQLVPESVTSQTLNLRLEFLANNFSCDFLRPVQC